MQILYWHLTRRPQSSSGSLSPPLLQRRGEIDASSTNLNSLKQSNEYSITAINPGTKRASVHQVLTSPPGGDAGDPNQSHPKAMEIENDDQTPTFYLLNAVDLPDDEDSALNHHLELIHGQNDQDNGYNGGMVAMGNGPTGGGGPPGGGGHYSNQPRKVTASKRKKRRSNDLARILCIEDESDDEGSVNVGPSKSKKAKLVVNLYGEDHGYSFAYKLPGSNQWSESDPIPYSERYLLDSIDHEQIPSRMLCGIEGRDGVTLMRYRNQVVAEIRDYRKSDFEDCKSNQSNGGSGGNVSMTNGNIGWNGGASVTTSNDNNHKKPVVTQVMLRPTTESLLYDFDLLAERAHQDKGGWNVVFRQSLSSGDLSHLLKDGSDSEYEFEVDIDASQKSRCNNLTYEQRLELEKKFINETAEPLCLDPSPQVGLIANRVQFEKLKWNTEELKQATRRWKENPYKHLKILLKNSDTSLNAPSLAEGRLDIEPFYNYVMTVRAKRELNARTFGLEKDKDSLKLPPISYQDYPHIDPAKNLEEILRIGQIPEPAQIRIFPNENFVRKIEEYTLETERRKRPHTTTLSIFQRNGMESYFGELEMESFLDPTHAKIGTVPPSTKCQFELGSSRNVTLYVKQFSDIFTEDGRRPCKITYQKVGQPPQVVYTNSYKSATPTTPTPASTATSNPPPPPQPQIIHVPQSQTVTAVTASVPQVISTIASPVASVPSGVQVQPTQTVAIATPVTSSLSPQNVGQTVTLPGIVSVQQQQQQQQQQQPQPQQIQLQRPQTPAVSGANIVVTGQATIASSTPSLPPVQIVHPQPRTNPQQLQQQQQQTQKPQQTAVISGQQRQIQIFSQQQQQQQQQQSQQQNQTQSVPVSQSSNQAQGTNVNLNVNLSSAGLTPQQVLTRPHIVNLQQQQQAAQQQLLQLTQQRIMRMKQQQPTTALAKLLLNLPSKPITVAVQPTPQNPTNVSSATSNTNIASPVCSTSSSNPSPVASASCNNVNSVNNTAGNNNSAIPPPSPADPPTPQQQQNPLGSPLMIQSPPSVSSTITNPSPNVNVNVNASPNVNVNLNTISLEGLLAASSASINYGTATTLTTNQAGSNLLTASNVNLGLSRITTSSGQPTVNILRLNNSTGTTMATAGGGNTVQLAAVQRQLAMSNALNGNLSILQQPGGSQHPQQRILINANSVNNLNLSSVGSTGEIDELSVPDLTTLLGGQPIQISQLGQQHHILTNAAASGPSQTTIDTTNLNLNLNVNLNSGVVNSGDPQVQQHQIAKIQGGEWTTTAQAPPFLVFISPLRPMSIATQAATNTTRQVTASSLASGQINNPSTLSLNLGTVQQHQQTTHIVQSQPGKVQEGPTRILLGTCNNGVAIKREVASSSASTSTSSAPSTIITSIAGTSSGSSNNMGGGAVDNAVLNQSQMMDTGTVDGHLVDGQHMVSSSDVVVDGVDSLFNALSEAIGPEQLQKLDAIGGSLAAAAAASVSSSMTTTSLIPSSASVGTVAMDTIPSGMRVVASSASVHSSIPMSSSSSLSAQLSNNTSSSGTITKNNSTNVITLSDLLGSSTVVSSSSGNISSFPSLILTSISNNSGSNNSTGSVASSSPTLSSLLNSVTPSSAASGQGSIMSVTQSSIVSSTPRLSALLAGTPSADTVVVGANGSSSIISPTGTPDSSTGTGVTSASYGSLLDRLAASLNQPQGQVNQVRSGASRLNPIATATPSVVLEHPVLAATLTQQQQQQQQQPNSANNSNAVGGVTTAGINRTPATFRQIAPAPSPVGSVSSAASVIGNSGSVQVISSSDVHQSHTIQSPQLINLLGLVGNNSGAAGQPRTIRISASSPANNPGSASR